MLNILNAKNKLSFLKNDCHIWFIDIDNDTYIQSLKYIDLLSNREINNFYSFRFQEDQERFIISHIALRKIISIYTDIPMPLIRFEYNGYGKPYLLNDIPFSLFFNLSHANNKAIIAINNSEIGADIEYIKNSLDIYELAKNTFSNFEYQDFLMIKSYDKKLKYFYTIWTKKEAYLKALSIGLVDDLKKVHIGIKEKVKVKNEFVVQNINVCHNEYIASIASKGYYYKNIVYFNYGLICIKEMLLANI
jgi:4'-phosphopantetheinyl transferase